MRTITPGATDVSIIVRIVDSTDGTPEEGVTSATAGLALWYRREGGLKVAIGGLSDLALLTTAHADGGLLHVDEGYYRVDVPDAAWATGAAGVLIGGVATGMVVVGAYHPLQTVQTGDAFARIGALGAGLTALATAAQGTAIQAKTDLIPGSPAAVGSAMTLTAGERTSIGTAVWASATRTLTSLSAIAADVAAAVWAYASRRLTQSAAEVTATVVGTTLTCRQYDTFEASLTGLGSLVGRQNLWFTAKAYRADTDAEALAQIEETDGLLRINGAAPVAANLGSIVVDDATAGGVTIMLTASQTGLLGDYEAAVYDVKWRDAGGELHTLTEALFIVTETVTNAVE